MIDHEKRRKEFLESKVAVHEQPESSKRAKGFLSKKNKSHRKKNLKKRLLISSLVVGALASITVIGLHVTGYAHFVADVYPLVKFQSKETQLKCDYAGKNLTTSIQVNGNVDNYYKYKRGKQKFLKDGDFSKFVYANQSDKTIHDLAGKVRQVATDNGLNEDQTLELATCFIQNIPYDEKRAEKVLTGGNEANYQSEQYPYETLYNNSGICTDKSYLGSLLLKELGFGTALLVFPEDQHMALGISVPSGYTDFSSRYAMMELTQTGFAPGSLPSGIDDNNGKPSYVLSKLGDLNEKSDPTKIDLDLGQKIAAPTFVIDINQGQSYTRIVPVKNLENKIYGGIDVLVKKKANLESAYSELISRDNAQENAYNYYLGVPPTKLDCGYHYNYSYNYFSSPYSYNSPTYSCDTVTNPSKGFAYSSYMGLLGGYNNQVSFYNGLISDYNKSLSGIKGDIDNYLSYAYN